MAWVLQYRDNLYHTNRLRIRSLVDSSRWSEGILDLEGAQGQGSCSKGSCSKEATRGASSLSLSLKEAAEKEAPQGASSLSLKITYPVTCSIARLVAAAEASSPVGPGCMRCLSPHLPCWGKAHLESNKTKMRKGESK